MLARGIYSLSCSAVPGHDMEQYGIVAKIRINARMDENIGQRLGCPFTRVQ